MTVGVRLDQVAEMEQRDESRALSARWPASAGLVLSLLLHAVFGLLVIEFQARDSAEATDTVIPVELVVEAPVPPPQPPSPPPEPQAQPRQPPPQQQPEIRQLEPPKLAPAPPPQIVQRETAPSADRSSAPRQSAPRTSAPEPAAPAAVPPPRPADSRDGLRSPAPPAEQPRPASSLSVGRGAANQPAGPSGEKLSQSEVDFLLAQVFKVWLIDYRSARFKDIVISGNFLLNPDGTLGAPFGVNDPWAPEKMVADYATLLRPEFREHRTALESFLAAMRQAQPFKRQPDAPPLASPKIMSFSFRLGDL